MQHSNRSRCVLCAIPRDKQNTFREQPFAKVMDFPSLTYRNSIIIIGAVRLTITPPQFFRAIEALNSQSEHGIQQELDANFGRVMATRLMTNEIDAEINEQLDGQWKAPKRINFKHALTPVGQNPGMIMMQQVKGFLTMVIRRVESIAQSHDQESPNRRSERTSHKPIGTFERRCREEKEKAARKQLITKVSSICKNGPFEAVNLSLINLMKIS
ncbi:MAG: hypothetical protein OXC62_17645 [Aestuariivita sp.]|nr:hypothetical protein [Aestuariivita sp.]